MGSWLLIAATRELDDRPRPELAILCAAGLLAVVALTHEVPGIVASFLCGDMIGVVMEVLAMLQMNQPEVQEWMSVQDI